VESLPGAAGRGITAVTVEARLMPASPKLAGTIGAPYR
jgi:hypothetical protein